MITDRIVEPLLLTRPIIMIHTYQLTICIRNLESIASFSGLFGFLICMVFPSLLELSSRSRLSRRNLSSHTPYTGVFTSDLAVYSLLVSGIIMTIQVCIAAVIPT